MIDTAEILTKGMPYSGFRMIEVMTCMAASLQVNCGRNWQRFVCFSGEPLHIEMELTLASFDSISEVNMVR
jgi:hypothetical protein